MDQSNATSGMQSRFAYSAATGRNQGLGRHLHMPGGLRNMPRWMRIGIFALGAAFCVTPWASPAIALALGMVLALSLENPVPRITGTGSKYLLQTSVVLLGFSMNLAVVLSVGKSGLLFAAATITGTFLLGYLLCLWLKMDRVTSTLISAGTAICGGSAVAAVGSSINAKHNQMTVAMGTVFLLNAVALYVFPMIGHALNMSQTQFGIWAGVAIHDVSSVVGAAASYGDKALQVATAVKLSRALWILPVTVVAALAFQRARSQSASAHNVAGTEQTKGKKMTSVLRNVKIPYFIGFFLLAAVARSFVAPVAAVAPTLTQLAEIGLTVTLFLIGANLSRQTLKAVGVKPLVQGVVLWLAISTASLAFILGVM